MQLEFVGGDRRADMFKRFVLAADMPIAFRVEHVIAILASELGLIHGLIRLTQQLIGVGILGLRVKRHAEAGRNLQRLTLDRHGLGSCGQQAVQHRHAGRHLLLIGKHGNELIAAEPRQRIALPQRLLHAVGKRHQQLIAGLVTIHVIDRLEPVEIDVHHGKLARTPRSLNHRLAQDDRRAARGSAA